MFVQKMRNGKARIVGPKIGPDLKDDNLYVMIGFWLTDNAEDSDRASGNGNVHHV